MNHPVQRYLSRYQGFPEGYLLALAMKHTPNTFQRLTKAHQTIGDGEVYADMVEGMIKEALRHTHVKLDAPELPHSLTDAGQRDHRQYLKSLDDQHRQQQERFWNGGTIDEDYQAIKQEYLESHGRNVKDWLKKATDYYRGNDVPVPERVIEFARIYGVTQ